MVYNFIFKKYILAVWLVGSLLPNQGLNLGPGQQGIPYNYSQF